MIRDNPAFFYYVMFSDEATFQNTGQLNRTQLSLLGLDVNPRWYRQIDNQHR